MNKPVQKKICPHCKREINAQLKLCPFCGGEIPDKFEKREPICPRCGIKLEQKIFKGEEYDICPECNGLWLDRGEFRRATRESDVYRDEEIVGEYLKCPSSEPVVYIPCARCGKLMIRKNFAKISGIIIDECSRHGVWLDAGELKKIRQFIADGGLERSQNKEIEAIRSELKEISIKVDETSFLQKILHFWNFKRWLFGR